MSTKISDALTEYGLKPDVVAHYQVICLPDKDGDMLLDPTDGVVLSKHFKAAGLRCANSGDLNLPSKGIERRGHELWLGIVWLMDHAIMPIAVGVILSTIFNRNPKKVNVSIRLKRGDDFTSLRYVGDAETLKDVLRGLCSTNPVNEKHNEPIVAELSDGSKESSQPHSQLPSATPKPEGTPSGS